MTDLAETLFQWAVQDMKFHTKYCSNALDATLPTVEDFNVLCKRSLSNVWRFAIKEIKDERFVQHVKDNLKVLNACNETQDVCESSSSELLQQTHKTQLEREKQRLEEELRSCTFDVKQLRKEMNLVQKEVLDLEQTYASSRERTKNLQRKESLLEIACRRLEERDSQYAALASMIDDRTAQLVHKSETKDEVFGKSSTGAFVETSTSRKVEKTCAEISEFLHLTITSPKLEKTKLEEESRELWSRLSELTTDRSSTSLVKALQTNALKAACKLRESTLQINVEAEVKDLNFSYSRSGRLKDVSSPTSTQESVSQLLLNSNMSHVTRYFEELDHKNKTRKLTNDLSRTLREIEKEIDRQLVEHPQRIQIVRNFVNSIIEAASEKTVLSCLRQEIEKLNSHLATSQEAKQELRKKLAQIYSFKDLVNKKHKLIVSLVRQNSGAPTRLDKQKKEVLGYLSEQAIQSEREVVMRLTDKMKESFSKEVDRVLVLALPCLLNLSLDSSSRVGILDLSIAHSVQASAVDMRSLLTSLCQELQFPSYKSIDCLPLHLLNLRTELVQCRCDLSQRQLAVEAFNKQYGFHDVSDIIELNDEQKRQDEAQAARALPRLDKLLERSSRVQKECHGLQTIVDEWWQLPAQFVAPWIRKNGLSYEQSQQQLRVLVSYSKQKKLDSK